MLTFILLLIALYIWWRIARWYHRRNQSVDLANDSYTEKRHINGVLTKLSSAAITTRNLLVKRVTDDDHITLAGAGDSPIMVCQEEADAAERTVKCQLLGCSEGTIILVSDGAGTLAIGDLLIASTNGQVAKAAATTKQHIVGKCLATVPATAGYAFEAEGVGLVTTTV